MIAEVEDLTIDQGSTFEWLILMRDVNRQPLDMSAYFGGTAGARGHIRKSVSDDTVMASFDCHILDRTGVVDAMSNGLLHIEQATVDALLSDDNGKCYLLVRLDAADTAAISANGVYDIEVEDTFGYVGKPYRGSVTLNKESTR